jgi:RNA polymerase sigma factor (sigma-70 family)
VNKQILSDKEISNFTASMRGELHRYCARMVGSVFDGEDLVQETIMRILQATAKPILAAQLRSYVFRTAHNAAIDMLRSKKRQGESEPIEDDDFEDTTRTPYEELARKQAIALALDQFLQLPQPQRSVVILKDVLGEKTSDIGTALGLSVQSVKAHLHRGRLRISSWSESAVAETRSPVSHPETKRYVEHFNSGNWSALRAMLAEDVILQQTGVSIVRGRTDVGTNFFSRYIKAADWKMSVASVEGREVVWVSDMSPFNAVNYFMVLEWKDDKLISITDFRHARYISDGVVPVESSLDALCEK